MLNKVSCVELKIGARYMSSEVKVAEVNDYFYYLTNRGRTTIFNEKFQL